VHKKQSGGSGQYADVSIKFEPGEAGTGFTFKSEIKGGVVPKEYIPGVVKGLEECMMNGALAGYPVVDLSATLYDGSYHDVDSSVLAFQIAARGAFRDAMKKGKCKLMEPIMKVCFVLPCCLVRFLYSGLEPAELTTGVANELARLISRDSIFQKDQRYQSLLIRLPYANNLV
jgi:hypothetical protein